MRITGIRSHCGCFAMDEEHLSEIICTARALVILHTERLYMHIENPVYLSETKLTDQITVNMRVGWSGDVVSDRFLGGALV